MKKIFKRCSLSLLLLLSMQGCSNPFFEPSDFSLEEDDAFQDAKGLSASQGIEDTKVEEEKEEGIQAYGEDIFNLTHDALSHWDIKPEYEVNNNGGFIVHLDNYNGDKEIATTIINGSKSFENINKLVFTLFGLDNKEIEVSIKSFNDVNREEYFLIGNDEQEFELFIGGLDLSKDFSINIKLKDDVNYIGNLVVRDIHFSAALLKDKKSPYVYDNENEFSLTRNSIKHWEVNHHINQKYDDKLVFNVNENDDTSLFAKTTVVGSNKLEKFKSIIIDVCAVDNNTSSYKAKVIIGSKEIILPLSYNNTASFTISLENLDINEDFDIYFYPSIDDNRNMTVEISKLILTPYNTAPLEVDGCEATFNALDNSFYHWSLMNDSDEKIIFRSDNTFEVDVKDTSSPDLRIVNSFKGLSTNDFNKAVIKIKGPQGNNIKISPVFSTDYYSYYSQFYFSYQLTGEIQEIEIRFNDYRPRGISIFPNEDSNNIPGKIEVLGVDYYEPEDIFKLENVASKVGENAIDITREIKDSWTHEGNNVTINDDGSLIYDLTQGDEPLSLAMKRSHCFANTDYDYIIVTYKSDAKFNSETMNDYSSSSGYVEVTPNIVQPHIMSLYTNDNFEKSNFKFSYTKYSSNTPVIYIYSVKLMKSREKFTGTDYENVAKYFDDNWLTTLDYVADNQGAEFNIPNNGEYYLIYAFYRPLTQIKFNSITIGFESLEKPLTLIPKIDSHTCEEQVLEVGSTIAAFNLTPPSYNWYTYNDYKIGFIVKNENNDNATIKITNYSLTPNS